jgi:hypothetical protein
MSGPAEDTSDAAATTTSETNVIVEFGSATSARSAVVVTERVEVTTEELEMVIRALSEHRQEPRHEQPTTAAVREVHAAEPHGEVRTNGGRENLLTEQRETIGYPPQHADEPVSVFPAPQGPPPRPVTSNADGQAAVVLVALPVSFDDYLVHGGTPVAGIPIECHQHHQQPPSISTSAGGSSPRTLDVSPVAAMNNLAHQVAEVWRACRALRMYCIAHVFIIALLLIRFVWSLAFCVLPVVGFFGARLYKYRLIQIYFYSFSLIVALRGFVTYSLVSDKPSTTMFAVYIALGVIGAALEIHMARHVWGVMGLVRELTHEQKRFLRGVHEDDR